GQLGTLIRVQALATRSSSFFQHRKLFSLISTAFSAWAAEHPCSVTSATATHLNSGVKLRRFFSVVIFHFDR
ncbi:MAG: hypothetical protein ABFS23_10335, partial [Pseudomonadota bacterium]